MSTITEILWTGTDGEKNMKGRVLLLIVAWAVALGTGCHTQRMRAWSQDPLPTRLDGSVHTRDQVQAAIVRACSQRGWAVQSREDGLVRALLQTRGRYSLQVAIHYTETRVDLAIEDSENLRQHGQRIHESANRWAHYLYVNILRNLRRP